MIRNSATDTITLSDPSGACRFEAVRLTDAQTCEILGWTQADLDEARAHRTTGVVTVTSIDRAAGVLTVGPSTAPYQGPVGHIRRRKVVR